jgi:ergothioneine biosynthesis protein EgtB
MSLSAAHPSSIDDPRVRAADHDLLSLALMDARNHTLHLLAAFDGALGTDMRVAPAPGVLPPLWIAGHVGWLAEYWIGRNPQRALGPACPAQPVRLASVDPAVDGWFNPALLPLGERFAADLPDAEAVKAYLLDTLETTLELLEKAPPDDAGLHFFRMALWHEDWRGEQLLALAQTLGVPLKLDLPAGALAREPIGLPATRWRLGFSEPGFAPAVERGDEAAEVPEFEIDAQPVSWAQYVEFIADGGYDRPELWRDAGWQWLERQAQMDGRRGPRHVEQIGVASGAVLQNLFGKPSRMGGSQPVMHASWWEADAYARWAGRRLPTEVEWEIAVHTAARRGVRWGDVWEWTAGTLRPLAGYAPDVWARDAELAPEPAFGQARVLRGASFAPRARMKHVKARAWAMPERDEMFVGFRTCAV